MASQSKVRDGVYHVTVTEAEKKVLETAEAGQGLLRRCDDDMNEPQARGLRGEVLAYVEKQNLEAIPVTTAGPPPEAALEVPAQIGAVVRAEENADAM